MANTGRNRSGSLYRRWQGKEYPINDKATQGKGVIWLRYMLNGKRHKISLKTSDIGEAKRKQKDFMAPLVYADEKAAIDQLALKANQAQVKLDKVLEDRNPPLSIADAWDAYISSHERPDSGQRTLKDYAIHWRKFTTWLSTEHVDVLLLQDITPDIALQYASRLTKDELSPNTFNKRISFLKLLCTTVADKARIETNPFEKIKSKKLKTESRRELTKHELKTVLESAKGDLKILLHIGTFTALRLGDCATLKWGEVDMDDLIIKRIPNKTRSRSPKPIMVGIPNALYTLLNDVPVAKRRGFVLPKVANEYQKDASSLTDKIQKHFEHCGIQTHKAGTGYQNVPDPTGRFESVRVHTGKRAVVEVGFHSLRHTFVSMQASMGTPQAVTQAIVGHGNPAMTAHYTHIGKEAAKSAAGLLNSGIQDADFEVIDPPIPKWVVEKLKTQTADNWETIRDELMDN